MSEPDIQPSNSVANQHNHDDHDHDDASHSHPVATPTAVTPAITVSSPLKPVSLHDDHDDHDDHDGHDEHDEHDGHDHPHDDHDDKHDHDDHDGHDHEKKGFFGKLLGEVVHSHSHDEEGPGRYLAESKRGIRALQISLIGLGLTAAFQVVIVIISGSAALLADTIHNFSDALTAIPLGIAFMVGRRVANRRYTYGYGRAEDLAGLFVVLMIALSSVVAFYESIRKLISPEPVQNLGWVAAAAVIGFIGNEAVAIFRIRVGREIGSAALVADGQHARVDGLTSLAVLGGAIGVWLGFPQADPIVGLLIGVAILLVLKDTAQTMYRRMLDAVDPEMVSSIEQVTAKVAGVGKVHTVRGRWIGHKLLAELSIEVDGNLTTWQSHQIGEEVRHQLWHKLPRLADVTVHVDPLGNEPAHAVTAHHQDASFSGRES